MEDKLLSSYSCFRCKQSHRKCDRLIEGCTNCKEKGKQCSYHELPRKPGPKPGDRAKRRPEPYPTTSPSTSPPAPMIPVIEVPPVIEGFFDSMFRVSPVFPHSKFSEILAHRHAIKYDLVPDSVPHNDDMALLYAMQVGNKLDLRKGGSGEVTQQEGTKMAEEIGAVAYMECSAKTLQGLGELFDRVTEAAVNGK